MICLVIEITTEGQFSVVREYTKAINLTCPKNYTYFVDSPGWTLQFFNIALK